MTGKPSHKRFAMIVSLCAALCLLTAGAAGAGPEDTIAKFEAAYNRMDLNTALECYEPAKAEAITSAVNLFSGIAGLGFQASDLFGAMPLFAGMPLYDENGNEIGALGPQISIRVDDTTISGSSAACSVGITLSVGGQTCFAADGVCTLVKENGTWYIADMR